MEDALTTTLVAGAAGFIGSHLVDRLLASGHRVVGLDDLSTGREAHLAGALRDPAFELVRADITRPLPPLPPVTRVYHLASAASPLDFEARALPILRAASEGTLRLLDLAEQQGARLILASSSEVYGEPDAHPQGEDTLGRLDPVGPRAVYSEAKRYAETLVTAWSRSRGTPVRIARLFNTYGPRMRPDDGRVVPAFATCALRGRPLPLHGDGSQTRSLCYVTDLVEGLVRLAESDLEGPCNLGRAEEIAIRDLGERICRVVGVPVAFERHPRPPGDPSRRCPDLARARTALGWQATTPLSQGLRATLAWLGETTGGDQIRNWTPPTTPTV